MLGPVTVARSGKTSPFRVAPLPRAVTLTGGLALVLSVLLGPSSVSAQQDAGPAALEAFGALVVGEWTSEGSRHEFTWGVGRQVIRSQSWFGEAQSWTLVSEGWWYWDPSEESIRGQTVAVNMGIDLFEHRSRVEGSEVVSDLVSHGEFGGEFVERWTFDDSGYDWILEQNGQRVMESRYTRLR